MQGRLFERFLVTSVIVILITGAYESYTQSRLPDLSILSFLHGQGLLTGYKNVYEPSKGIWHLVGWTGSFMMVIMMVYSIRKRFSAFSSLGSLRRWLEFHMFLGITGPILVTLHTTFKLGGIIATSFWCMIVTMTFGILGRYIYVQIPRNLAGAELKSGEIDGIISSINSKLSSYSKEGNDPSGKDISSLFKDVSAAATKAGNPVLSLLFMMRGDIVNILRVSTIKRILKKRYHLSGKDRRAVASLLKKRNALIRRRNFLSTSHSLLHYWHVLHVPLAVVMFVIMFLHIVVYFLFTGGEHAI